MAPFLNRLKAMLTVKTAWAYFQPAQKWCHALKLLAPLLLKKAKQFSMSNCTPLEMKMSNFWTMKTIQYAFLYLIK